MHIDLPELIGFVNDKGGVGKSFLTINQSFNSAKLGLKTLILDGDIQGNTSSLFLPDRHAVPGMETIFSENPTVSFVPAQIDGEIVENLFISASNNRFPGALNSISGTPGSDYLLREALIRLSEEFKFDLIAADMPPNPFAIQKNNLITIANQIITPYIADKNSVEGILGIIKSIARTNDRNPIIRTIHNNSLNRKSLNRQATGWIKAIENNVIDLQETSTRLNSFIFVNDPLVVRSSTSATDWLSNGYPVDMGAPASTTNEDLWKLTEVILRGNPGLWALAETNFLAEITSRGFK